MKIHFLQHAVFEGLDCIAGWIDARDHVLTCSKLYQGDPLPELTGLEWLIVMGGPMNVDETDRYPWLKHERKFIQAAIENRLLVTGICLGAQLIARALGAKVAKNPYKEIGWFPVTRDGAVSSGPLAGVFPERFDALHWHGDTFELPAGAARIASSAACPNQGFVYQDRVIALQFHLELTAAGLQRLIEHCAGEIVAAPYIQSPAEMRADAGRFKRINELMYKLLDYQASLRGK
jgi:GMP synthase (glutamine-hydrolysing)